MSLTTTSLPPRPRLSPSPPPARGPGPRHPATALWATVGVAVGSMPHRAALDPHRDRHAADRARRAGAARRAAALIGRLSLRRPPWAGLRCSAPARPVPDLPVPRLRRDGRDRDSCRHRLPAPAARRAGRGGAGPPPAVARPDRRPGAGLVRVVLATWPGATDTPPAPEGRCPDGRCCSGPSVGFAILAMAACRGGAEL